MFLYCLTLTRVGIAGGSKDHRLVNVTTSIGLLHGEPGRRSPPEGDGAVESPSELGGLTGKSGGGDGARARRGEEGRRRWGEGCGEIGGSPVRFWSGRRGRVLL